MVCSSALGLLEKAARVIPEKLLFRVRLEARPSENVLHRVGELTLRVGVVRGVHQHVVTEKCRDGVKHVLAFLALYAAEKPAARHVLARSVLQRRDTADIRGLLVHAPRPRTAASQSHTRAPPSASAGSGRR